MPNISKSNDNHVLYSRGSQPTNFLTFSDLEEFNQQLEDLRIKSNDELKAWETDRNFRSLRSAFDAIVKGEELLSAKLDSLSLGAIQYFNKLSSDSIDYYRNLPPMHCKEASDFQQTYIIVTEGDGSFFEPNINNYNYAYLTNTYGIVKIGTKIYQFTKEFIKTIDDGDEAKIDLMMRSTVNNESDGITVTPVACGYIKLAKLNSTSTFVRSAIGNSGRNRTIVYQNWDQLNSTFQPNKKVTTYKIRVRSLIRRLWGAWYDNNPRLLSLSGNTSGNITYGQLSNNNFVTINWSFGIGNSTSGNFHTWDFFLPNKDGMNQSLNALVTDGSHPQLYSSYITANASGGAGATTTYP